ncbi:hypothetical protein SCP_0109760 [Sparassis crispa]|uniref:Uncharacterized protein n=1 Tax=Sparassis crispa TaxID=139825 RepID=A0A401G7G1_9APHY|nr:hypothetical protein SCP_0109760 [Sparassis crispa]GBE78094.1 hypothetical protein SCP_0109760 [Sparassis crispa]
MRSPVIAFSIFAAAAVSPTLVSGAPTSSNPTTELESAVQRVARQLPNQLSALGLDSSTPQAAAVQPETPDAHRAAEEKLHNPVPASADAADPASVATGSRRKRASDQFTAGGNSYSGASSGTSGGTITNDAQGNDNAGPPTLINDGTAGAVNNAGNGGESTSGFSYGGFGDGEGPGGNAYSGSTGPSNGGSTQNSGNGITNTNANFAGTGGTNESGDSHGGDATGPPSLDKRSGDNNTGGGNAYSGATSNVSGGNVINQGHHEGTITNQGGNNAGIAGSTESGFSTGGDGNGLGPGGNAYTGASGAAYGGGVTNSDSAITNTAGANTAGTGNGVSGGESETGDAQGGNAK